MMAEYDNAGFPLTYCLLSTATAIDQGKRTKALSAWAKCLRDQYGVNPQFTHVDKDLAEIGCLKEVWNSKISLCWWHLRRAVRTRLAKGKLSTTPYNSEQARQEFDFIDATFVPPGTRVDFEDYEGGLPNGNAAGKPPLTATQPTPPTLALLQDKANVLRIKIPVSQREPIVVRPGDDKENGPGMGPTSFGVSTVIQGPSFRLKLLKHVETPIDTKSPSEEEVQDVSGDEEELDDGKTHRRTFCPALYREPIINMMERHYCAHPLIPGFAPPECAAIKRWAVQQMYNFCAKHELPEVWAYLWENWYRKGRWELWARSIHAQIPILKTTMIVESQ